MTADFMREELSRRYAHLWRALIAVAEDFDEESWKTAGFGKTTPGRTACHILISTKYYIGDPSPVALPSGGFLPADNGALDTGVLPDPSRLAAAVPAVAQATEEWLRALDPEAPNADFPWAGPSRLSVALFLYSHSLYHLGELNALLNQVRRGAATDHFAEKL